MSSREGSSSSNGAVIKSSAFAMGKNIPQINKNIKLVPILNDIPNTDSFFLHTLLMFNDVCHLGFAEEKPCVLHACNGNPIQGANIQFQIHDGASWSNIDSANTDSNGVVSVSYTPLNVGTF